MLGSGEPGPIRADCAELGGTNDKASFILSSAPNDLYGCSFNLGTDLLPYLFPLLALMRI